MTVLRPVAYQRNAWYAPAQPSEASGTPMRRLILGEPAVFFRISDGEAVALEDRCCHRLAPLSPGQVLGDVIECPYHGLRFDRHGTCTHVPGQATVPARSRVQAYPLLEQYGFFWIWMGDSDRADPARLPDWRWADDDE